MNYIVLLWPHANARYRSEALKLARAEMSVMLGRVAPDTACEETDLLGLPALTLTAREPLSPEAVAHISGHSLLYGLFARAEGGALLPISGRVPARVGEDLPGILKYKGKTNELFTELLWNVALYAGQYWQLDASRIRALDPMCGRGTGVFVAANRGWICTGSDVNRADLREAEQFLERYLKYHRMKHQLEHHSLTARGKANATCEFAFSPDAEAWREGRRSQLRLVNLDARDVRDAFGGESFHVICCDLPYGVQHGAHGASVEALLRQALPAWRDALKSGGTIAVAMNAQTLKPDAVRNLMREAGMTPLEDGAYLCFAHWVEQAVTRDIAVCRKD